MPGKVELRLQGWCAFHLVQPHHTRVILHILHHGGVLNHIRRLGLVRGCLQYASTCVRVHVCMCVFASVRMRVCTGTPDFS